MSSYPIFSVLGIEIEYMLVDRDTLAVQPKSDAILHMLAGELVNEVPLGEIAASNELVMHVLELKNYGPKAPKTPIAEQFQQTILELQPRLQELNLQFLPTGAHPWMDPLLETHRWPHGDKSIYQQYDEIFNCQGHGWANLQSMHVNLPFSNDEEFAQLHNAVRLLLPLIPALAASTPFLDGKPTGLLDSRLDFYGRNQQRIPSISGQIIPEFITSKAQYEKEILNPMYADIRAFDPNGILQYEWLNSRGAIAKFESMAVEIRIIDSQECVYADIAIAHAIHAILNHWHQNSALYLENICPSEPLKAVYDASMKYGLAVEVDDSRLLEQWQLPPRRMSLREVWTLLIERISSELNSNSQLALEHILSHGNLSERILRACQNNYNRDTLKQVYRQLGNCLIENKLFKA
ncbi:carboxylate-amine ligase [Legionella impletisoli]|uniref:Glutamate--cysteine ligase n=1 Tax=Legionella impletisoli TaxID=343510 RepID=A0A917JTW6_9GAMM|nr:glutamate-cysteine ligase family protein [Legionella impletisoli]GGI83912.1 glutamate--cysteine ligase [Legionella impletisoli]